MQPEKIPQNPKPELPKESERQPEMPAQHGRTPETEPPKDKRVDDL